MLCHNCENQHSRAVFTFISYPAQPSRLPRTENSIDIHPSTRNRRSNIIVISTLLTRCTQQLHDATYPYLPKPAVSRPAQTVIAPTTSFTLHFPILSVVRPRKRVTGLNTSSQTGSDFRMTTRKWNKHSTWNINTTTEAPHGGFTWTSPEGIQLPVTWHSTTHPTELRWKCRSYMSASTKALFSNFKSEHGRT